jgi:hypothetical protein
MIRKFLVGAVAVLITGCCVPSARADGSSDVTFTCSGSCSVLPANATEAVTGPDITSLSFTLGTANLLTLSGLDVPDGDQLGWSIAGGEVSITDETTDSPVGAPITINTVLYLSPATPESGSIVPGSVSVAAPEPSSSALTLLGAGLALLAFKRTRLSWYSN